MGLLRDLTASEPTGQATDAGPLRDLISATVNADGVVDLAEHVSVEALYETIPQLRNAPDSARPPQNRKACLAELAKLTDARLKRQLFVLAVDLALASEGATDREDVFVDELRIALGLDDKFAKQVISVLSYKYARAV
jgi:hypothetical protein